MITLFNVVFLGCERLGSSQPKVKSKKFIKIETLKRFMESYPVDSIFEIKLVQNSREEKK